jgi:hypothetical protein
MVGARRLIDVFELDDARKHADSVLRVGDRVGPTPRERRLMDMIREAWAYIDELEAELAKARETKVKKL